MAAPAPTFSPLVSRWERFVRGEALDAEALRPEIAQSWLRCRRFGVDPFTGRSRFVLPQPRLEALLEQRRHLIDVARPFMGNLYQFVADSSFVVLLCDERGYVLETTGDPDVIRNAPDLNFKPGALWTEKEIGNNGVGTALFLRQPFQISGAEHYCRKHHPWTCSGAPIFDERGTMVGALEMSGPVEETHQHTLGMVVAAVEAIQQQLRVHAKNRELVLLNNHLSNLFLSVSDGVIVVDVSGTVQQINPVALKILSARSDAVVGNAISRYTDKPGVIREMLEQGRVFSDLEINVTGPSKSVSCLASGKPIRDEQGRITSGAVFLNPIHRINKLINRFSGAHATFTFDDILGSGKALTRAIQASIQAADSESTVLLCGESGTGKEMFAQAIHNRSARRQGPFIAVNCGAIPRELIGSELFGYVEGAFTGAHKRGRPGKFELAAGGTLFLDEIGDMPLEQQASLLRVLQDKSVTRIGSEKSLLVNVRIICATNKDLPHEIAKGNFRQDLYYRLNVLSIRLPSLREHKEDIPLLFKTFHQNICRKLGMEPAKVDSEVVRRLQDYHWPGNVREFHNVVEKLVNASRQHPMEVSNLPEEFQLPGKHAPLPAFLPEGRGPSLHSHRARIRRQLIQRECQEILEAVSLHGGNVSETARAMGVSRSYLYRKLAKWPSA